jgi:hypothetical protein
LPPAFARGVETVRHEWDPGMAALIPAHVTLVYPEEAPSVELLVERLRSASPHVQPFRLRTGTLSGSDTAGVFVDVEDVDGGFRALRDELLRPPFDRVAFVPHVTLVHPRTSSRGAELRSGGPPLPAHQFTARDVAITAFDGVRWAVLQRFPLGRRGGPRPHRPR